MITLSVLIPVYNERSTIGEVLEAVLAAPLPEGVELKVVVVDDGSSDGSTEHLRKISSDDQRVRLVEHEQNRGKGAAIRTALEHAEGEIGVIQDADLEYSPNDYPQLLAPILDGNADVVYGSRFLAAQSRKLLYWHSVGNKLLTTLCNMFSNLNLTDMETCYKAFRIDVLDGVPLRSRSFTIEPELTLKFAQLGCRVYEVPITYHGRTYAEGKKIGAVDGFKAIGAILRYGIFKDLGENRVGAIAARGRSNDGA